MNLMTIGFVAAAVFGAIGFLTMLTIRVVVPTNFVHIVQSGRQTISYGRGLPAGNVYYSWPASMPLIGVKTTILPVSVFSLKLNNYNAYDKGRVPFVIDIVAFFRIDDSNMAAERVTSYAELQSQLVAIIQGAARTILATSEIEEILENRGIFGDKFTHEVETQLKAWGCTPVKNIELMDIRDEDGSKVIANIMAKKKSLIESQSRIEVAQNIQNAQLAEVAAQQTVQVRQQEAMELVGIRTAQKEQMIGIQNQKAMQAVKDEERLTTEKEVAVKMTAETGAANIQKSVQLVAADQAKQTAIIRADGEKQQTIIVAEGAKQQTVLTAEGHLSTMTLEAQGIQAQGLAKAEAEKALQLAPVTAQITLAKEIGENGGYQTYLISIRQIEANQSVGVEQARALQKADVKIIASAGNAADGATSAMDLFGPKGGMRLGAMLEAFKNTEAGKALLNGGDHAQG